MYEYIKERNHHRNHNNIKKQNAIKLASMMPSLLFLDPILPIKLLIPGT